ncbi:hypothetical protein [Kordiimonas pumila]|uniref:Mobilization protein n=1 Tax=Kordiimonas pumila TaxID=2161677 RepID=A0ABV7D3R9_9PROT|nr:hypothetical protein [Kordiimonas pumila]
MTQPSTAKPAKKPAPFSLRLTKDEKAKLVRRAKGKPLGAFIKAQLFEGNRAAITKSDAATVLAILGSSDLARSMACIAKAAEIGALPVTEELSEQLEQACTDIRTMRAALLRKLGVRPQ